MKIQLKSVLQFAVIALALGVLCLSASLHAQSAPQPSATPDANKKEDPYVRATPTPPPKG